MYILFVSSIKNMAKQSHVASPAEDCQVLPDVPEKEAIFPTSSAEEEHVRRLTSPASQLARPEKLVGRLECAMNESILVQNSQLAEMANSTTH